MIAFINDWADAWLNVFGYAVVQNTIFLIVIFLLLSILKRIEAKYKYAIGCIGLAKCLIPPFLPLPVLRVLEPVQSLPAASTGLGSIQIIPTNFVEMPTATTFLFIAWLMVALAFLLVPLGATLILKLKLRRSGSDVSNETHPQNGRFQIRLLHSDHLHIPLSLGFLPDSIYLPRLWRNLPQECRRVMLQHELAHIRRRDGLVQFFQIIVQAIYFFNPIVWLLNAKINDYREMACDDEAVARTNVSPMIYSKYLVRIAENVVRKNLGYSSVSALIKRKNKLLKRVHYQMREVTMHNLSKTKMAILIAGLLLLIVPLSWTSSNKSPVDQTAPSEIVEQGKIRYEDEQFRQLSERLHNGLNLNATMPEAARKAGARGQVTVRVVFDDNGVQQRAFISSSTFKEGEDYGCHQVALDAVNAVKWSPLLKANKQGQVPIAYDINLNFTPDGQSTSIAVSPDLARAQQTEAAAGENNEDFFRQFFPWPEKGLEEIKKNLVYPDAARKAGLGGMVIVKVEVNELGELKDVSIVKSSFKDGNDLGCHQAALDAVRAVNWQKASLAGKGVSGGYGYNIPIKFALDSSPQEQTTEPPPPPPTGKIYGSIKDKETGEPLPGVNVVITGTTFGAASDREGNYFIINVPPGLYTMQFSFIGYKSVIVDDVRVAVEKSTEIDAALESGVVETTAIIVHPDRPEGAGAKNADKAELVVVSDDVEKVNTDEVKLKEDKASEDATIFVAYDEPPEPVGGFKALQKVVVYPEIAHKAGVEGIVYVKVFVSAKGEVTETQVLKSLGNNGCDEAAINAIKAVKWIPAKQRGKPVGVWVSIPVLFKLNKEK